MLQWWGISLLLCTFGFFRELRPNEPFVNEFLTGEWRNLTAEQVNREIFPIGTYAVLAQLVIVFLVTDILRYKPVIVASACAGLILFAISLWTRTILDLQIGQIFYGTFTASEVAYYTYIYAKVDKQHYQIVTGHTRSAILCGKFLAAVLGQVLYSTQAMDPRQLHYITFSTQIVSLVIALALPSVPRSLYFYTTEAKVKEKQTAEVNGLQTLEGTPNKPKFSWSKAMQLLWQHAVSAYTNSIVLQWSLWWALATAGQVQIISYVQILWKEIDPYSESMYNGAVEAVVTLLGATGAMAAGLMNNKRHKKWHMSILSFGSLCMGVLIVITALTQQVVVAYVLYVLFGILYFFVITVASASVAEQLSEDSFGLIFGINTLLALIMQTLLTVIIINDDIGFGLNVRTQFIVYGCYYLVLAFIFFLVAIATTYCKRTQKENVT